MGFLIKYDNKNTSELTGIVVKKSKNSLSVKDDNDVIYTFNHVDDKLNVGDNVIVTYMGLLDKSLDTQKVRLIECIAIPTSTDDLSFFLNRDTDIFRNFYTLANNYVNKMSLDEKIGQILLVRYSSNYDDAINKYHVGGFVFFENDFKDKSKDDVVKMINNTQKITKTPLLTAVDEEGGNVVRVSSNPNLRSQKFKSPSELYTEGGFDLIKSDTVEKSDLLRSLGLNVNLAPVVDVSSSSDYMWNRTLKENTDLTSEYASTVVEASKNSDVSYVLKHFPGYGNNSDTHSSASVDNRTLDELEENDLPPFQAGINSGAEAILVSHNTVNSVDSTNPASLSLPVHELLRNSLGFSGVIMTDDLAMGATSSIPNAVSKAFLAGNDIVMVTDYEEAFDDLKSSVESGSITEEMLDNAVNRVIAWKFYKGLMFDTK